MALSPKCDKCTDELVDFGGILLSPPNENDMVRKYHLCKSCYAEIVASFPNDTKDESR